MCVYEQTAIHYLYSINWIIFMTEKYCAYCAVRAEYLTLIWAHILLLYHDGHDYLRPLTAEARILSQASPCESRNGKNGAETGFPQSISLLFLQFHSTNAT